MAYEHPDYPGLMVYEGLRGEKARAGAFFMPGSGRTFLQECGAAYGSSNLATVRRVNGHPWNVEQGHLGRLTYRRNDTNCNAPIVSPDYPPGAAQVGFGAHNPWIAFCPYQDSNVIWFPPKNEWQVRPEDLVAAPPPTTFAPPTFQKQPPPVPGVYTFDPSQPGQRTRTPGMMVIDEDEDYYVPPPGLEPDKSRKWWIIGGITVAVVAAGAGIYVWRRK